MRPNHWNSTNLFVAKRSHYVAFVKVAKLSICAAILAATGCCCGPAMNSCGTGCTSPLMSCDSCGPAPVDMGCDTGCGCDSCGPKAPGLLAGLASCRGGCGEVYYGERINHPPVADNCGYDCGGCGNCGQCRPLVTLLQKLWGRPYMSSCDSSFLCGPSCGCDSCGGDMIVSGHVGQGSGCSSCQGGHVTHHPTYASPSPIASPDHSPSSAPAIPMEVMPQTITPANPTPAPNVTPSSARRLNPAQSRVRHASYSRSR